MLKLLPFSVLMHVHTRRQRQFENAAALYDAVDAGPQSDEMLEKELDSAFDALNECVAEISRRRPVGVQALQRVQALVEMAELRDDPVGEMAFDTTHLSHAERDRRAIAPFRADTGPLAF